MNRIKRALISVFDKTGVVELARSLAAMDVEIISTGGTAELFRKQGIAVREVSDITQFPEMLDGRVKTLHPMLHGGLLALRDNPEHMKTIAKHGIRPIDLVVVNLYPFADAVKTKHEEKEIIEMIDIGGPSMIRSAAKNYRFVASVCDPADYAGIVEEMRAHDGALTDETRRRLSGKVFATTAKYDGMIADYFNQSKKDVSKNVEAGLPESFGIQFNKITDLRYGENPHQKGALYTEHGKNGGIVSARKLHGKELSFNNILDLDAAWGIVSDFQGIACSIIKHCNPCGFAVAATPREAFKKALACDPLSAFGGIIGFNTTVDLETAKAIIKSGFMECVVAAGFKADALKLLQEKKNLRLLTMDARVSSQEHWDFKKVSGGLLLQDRDVKEATLSDLKYVTKKRPTKAQIQDLLFAFKVSRYLKSNAIAIAKKGATLGLGMGQTSRVDSAETAFRKAGKRAKSAVLASDGFFPKPDSIALAKKAGIAAIIQPGGSIQDEAVIQACDRAKIAMVLTGLRHFKH